MKKLISGLFLLLCSVCVYADTVYGICTRVVDGDTIIVCNERVRLAYIDAPEKKQKLGQASKQFLESLILYKKITIKYTKRDRYGRIIGEIYLGNYGFYINLAMVLHGYAYVYRRYCPKTNRAFYIAEEIAMTNRVGVWQNKNQKPWNFRKK